MKVWDKDKEIEGILTSTYLILNSDLISQYTPYIFLFLTILATHNIYIQVLIRGKTVPRKYIIQNLK